MQDQRQISKAIFETDIDAENIILLYIYTVILLKK